MKPVNSHMSSSFQPFKDSIIKNFKNKPVVQDIDLIRLDGECIKSLIEVKKAKELDWKPYTKIFKPHLPVGRRDDINYKALFALGKKMGVNVWIFHYVEDKLTEHGVACFKIVDIELNMTWRTYSDDGKTNRYSLEEIESVVTGTPSTGCAKRNSHTVKDFNNPNINKNQNNLFYFFQSNDTAKHFYYVECGGIWTMLISHPTSYEPIWLYIELDLALANLDLDDCDLKAEFFPQIEIHDKTGIPLSIICYDNNDLQRFTVYKYDEDEFHKQIMSRTDFIDYYGAFIALIN